MQPFRQKNKFALYCPSLKKNGSAFGGCDIGTTGNTIFLASMIIFYLALPKLTFFDLFYREEATVEDEVAARIIGHATMQERYISLITIIYALS